MSYIFEMKALSVCHFANTCMICDYHNVDLHVRHIWFYTHSVDVAFQKYKTKILTLKRGLNIRYRLSIRRFVANKKKGGGGY